MNNIITNFEQILQFARDYNLPVGKKRGILREYLQTKILELLYQEKLSKNIFFIGGTSLRILRGSDRFSEDLDFDLEEIELSRIDSLMEKFTNKLKKENLELELVRKVSGQRRYFELRFKDLLYQLNISRQEGEKLKIKLDFENIWQGHAREVILLNRYGFLANIISIPLDQLLIQKLTAYARRKQTQPRDIYDIVWLVSRNAKADRGFAKRNKIAMDFLDQARAKFVAEKSKLAGYKRKLRPFLIEERDVNKLDFFPQMLEELSNTQNNQNLS